MKLIIGLGNLGKKYAKNRHNVGYMVVDSLRTTAHSNDIKVFKSDKFMNDSGVFVHEKLKAYSLKPETLYVIHDDLDIKLGEYKIQFAKGPKDHNGIEDVENKLNTKGFWRIRVGVDNRNTDLQKVRTPGDMYVLEDFTEEEMQILSKVIKEVVKLLGKL